MTKLTKEEVQAVAHRAMLELTEEEAEMFAEDLSSVIAYADNLNELDTENVIPMTHALQQLNVMREDVVENVLDREDMLESVKEHQAGEILVPTIL